MDKNRSKIKVKLNKKEHDKPKIGHKLTLNELKIAVLKTLE